MRVEDIAEAAGVSPRTYNNYFSSREQAIVAAVTADREARVAAAVAARPASVRLADAVTEAIVEQYTGPGSHVADALLLITTSPALRDAFLDTAAAIEHPLTAVIADRPGVPARTPPGCSRPASPPQSASHSQHGCDLPPRTAGSSYVSGSLPDLLRTTLAPLAPALDAAERRPRQ